MKIITGTEEDLNKMLDDAHSVIPMCKSADDRYALYNYIGLLYNTLESMGAKSDEDRLKRCFGTQKEYNDYNYRLEKLLTEYERNFISNKGFHNKYLGQILDESGEALDDLQFFTDSGLSDVLREQDYYELFFGFLKSVGLEEHFDSFIKNKKIFFTNNDSDELAAAVLYNPINKNMGIVFNEFGYTLADMCILAHEFGHVYDFVVTKENSGEQFLKYLYLTTNGETIPRVFEKLFFDYVSKLGIMSGQLKDRRVESLFANRDSVIATHMFSVLDDKILRSGHYIDYSVKDWCKAISSEYDEETVKEVLRCHGFSLQCDPTYAYGDIMSYFLKQSIVDGGFDNELMNDFMSNRCKSFSPEFIEKHDLNAKVYRKLYQNEVNQCKN